MATDTLPAATAIAHGHAYVWRGVWIVTAYGDAGEAHCSFAIETHSPALMPLIARAQARKYNVPEHCRLKAAPNYPGATPFLV